MKHMVALFCVVNLGALLWLQFLPAPSRISGAILDQDTRGKPGAFELQAQTSRAQQELFAKHRTATHAVIALLAANTIAFFLASVLLEARGEPRENLTEQSHGEMTSKSAPNTASEASHT